MPRLTKNNFSCPDIGIFILIILCGLALYFHPLQSKTFYFDDRPSVQNDEILKTLNIPKIFNAFNTRFLVGLSLALNYQWCGLHPAGYRFINVLIHCFNAFLVYLLAKIMSGFIRATARVAPTEFKWPAFFASILFLCHPIQTEAVNYITQRFVLMGTFFYLLTLLLYIKDISCHPEQSRSKGVLRFFAPLRMTAWATACAAMFCKEFVVTLPLMLTLYEFYFINFKNETIGRRLRRLIPFFVIVLIVPILLLRTPPQAIVVANIADSGPGHHIDISRAKYAIGRQQYSLTELNVVCTYIRLLILPVNQNIITLILYHQGTFKDFLSGVFLICLLAIAVVTYKFRRIVSFGILWFFIALSVESSIIPIGHVISEYRLYLASVGFVLLVANFLYSCPLEIRRLNMIAAAILIGFSTLTYQRNKIWENEMILLNDILKKSPHNANMHNDRGLVYYLQGDLPQALLDYNKAIELNPIIPFPYNNLGWAYYNQGKYSQAILEYNKAIAVAPIYARSYFNRALAYYHQGNYPQAISDFNKALDIDPEHSDTHYNRGLVYYKQGKINQAISDFKKAIEIDPRMLTAYISLGSLYYKQGNSPQALLVCNKVIELNPNDAQAHYNRGNLYMIQNNLRDALSDYNKAIELNSKFTLAYYNRGLVWDKQGNFNQAISDYNKAIAIDPRNADAYINRAVSYYWLNEFDKAWGDVRQAEGLGHAVSPDFISVLKQASGHGQ